MRDQGSVGLSGLWPCNPQRRLPLLSTSKNTSSGAPLSLYHYLSQHIRITNCLFHHLFFCLWLLICWSEYAGHNVCAKWRAGCGNFIWVNTSGAENNNSSAWKYKRQNNSSGFHYKDFGWNRGLLLWRTIQEKRVPHRSGCLNLGPTWKARRVEVSFDVTCNGHSCPTRAAHITPAHMATRTTPLFSSPAFCLMMVIAFIALL